MCYAAKQKGKEDIRREEKKMKGKVGPTVNGEELAERAGKMRGID